MNKKPYLYIDFEFCDTSEPNLSLVSVSALDSVTGQYYTRWLFQDKDAQEDAKNYFLEKQSTHTMVAYSWIAEGRSFLALGLNPMEFTCIDLYADWKLLQNRNDKFLYGTYFKDGEKRCSDAGYPSRDGRHGQKDPNIIGSGLADCIGRLLEIDLDKIYKGDTVGLILSRSRGGNKYKIPFSDEEKSRILEYNESDIVYLSDLRKAMLGYISEESYNDDLEDVEKACNERALYMCALSRSENLGMPIHIPYLDNISKNYKKIKEIAIKEMNATYPIWYQERSAKPAEGRLAELKTYLETIENWPRTSTGKVSTKASLLGENYDNIDQYLLGKLFVGNWKRKSKLCNNFIGSLDVKGWPKTPNGSFSTEDKILKGYRHIPEVKVLRDTSRTIQQIKWFRPEGAEGFRSKIGSDERSRFFFNPFGSQTGRNQPPAKNFVLAMSSWLRCMMKPKPGWEITTIDYASQEFAIAADLSQDQNMIDAYESGDPYLYFAKLAGAVPWDGTKAEYKTERDTFKAVVLGLQFGLGVDNLALKLTSTLKRHVSREETQELINKHKRAFSKFWNWNESILDMYFNRKDPLILGTNTSRKYDGLRVGDQWALFNDNANPLSVGNFPVQGTGAAIMRDAVIGSWNNGVSVISPLHDAIYFLHKEEEREEKIKIASECMDLAVKKYMDTPIRLDIETYTHEDDYVPAKGKEDFEKFKEYIVGGI